MSSGSLLGRVYKMLPDMEDAEPHPIVADFAVAIAVDVDEQEMETIAIAMTLTDDIAVDALKSLPSKAEILEPDFTVDEPLTAVGQIATEDGNVIKLAKLSRDDAFYLVGTSADATELAKFAVNAAVAEAKTPDNVYAVVKIGGEYLSENGLPAAPDFKAEIGLSSTESAVKLHLWTNLIDAFSSILGVDLHPLLSGTEDAGSPLVVGSGPLMALINLSLACLPSDLTPADLPNGEELWAMASGYVEEIGFVGFSVTDPAPIVVASGDKGLLAAAMNSDELLQTPTVAEGIAAAVDQDVEDVEGQDAEDNEDEDEDKEEDEEETKEIISAIIENLDMLNAIEIYSEGTGLLAIEITPDPRDARRLSYYCRIPRINRIPGISRVSRINSRYKKIPVRKRGDFLRENSQKFSSISYRESYAEPSQKFMRNRLQKIVRSTIIRSAKMIDLEMA